jgi:hypothetical protein
MIFLAGRGWWIRLGWQWCLGTCLACAILFVSGYAKMTVPNVEGLTQDAATTAITGAKLTVGTVTQQTSNTVATGKVISQDPASGSSVAQGSPVNLANEIALTLIEEALADQVFPAPVLGDSAMATALPSGRACGNSNWSFSCRSPPRNTKAGSRRCHDPQRQIPHRGPRERPERTHPS